MIIVNILGDYKFLFTFTAMAVSFIPVVHANANPNDFGTPCTIAKSVFTNDNGGVYTVKDKTYSFFDSANGRFVAFVSIKNPGTVLNVLRSNITVDTIVDQPRRLLSYGMHVKDGGKLVLIDSNIKDISGFRVQNGQVVMNRGKIEGAMQVVCAEGKKTDIALATVDIEIASNNSNVKGMGFVSSLGAFVRMSGSTVTFNGSGAFSAYSRGRYLIDTTNIKGKGKKYTIVVDDEEASKLPAAFDILQGSPVLLRGDSIQLTDMHGFVITNFSGYAYKNGKLIEEFDSSDTFKNTDIVIERSNIVVQGKETYGFYFNGLDPDIWADILQLNDDKLSKVEGIVSGVASVSLSKTTVNVPDSIAIYSTGSNDYGAEAIIKLSNQTRISGDLLLKAENNSSILVIANDSTLIGGIRVEDISTVDLQLAHGSTWYLTKSEHTGLQGNDSTVSSVSSISLLNSTIAFDHYRSPGYQTLRIGPKNDISQTTSENSVYSAKGNVQIKMSTFVNNDGLFDSQKTDRILIYGDVSGTTLLQLDGFSKISEKATNGQGNPKGGLSGEGEQSISLIQVSGIAQENSFTLLNYQSDNYVVVNGSPYQYHLRAYGPSSSHGNANAQNRLLSGSGDFWDFRLEAVYLNPKTDSAESVSLSFPTMDSALLAESTPTESPSEPSSPLLPSPSETPNLVDLSSIDSVSLPSETDTLVPTSSVPSPSIEPTVESVHENSTVETTPVLPISSSLSAESFPIESTPALSEASVTQSPSVVPMPISTPTESPSSVPVEPSTIESTPMPSDQENSLLTNFTSSSESVTSELSSSSLSETPVLSTSNVSAKSSSVQLVSTKISITGPNPILSKSDTSGPLLFASSNSVDSTSVSSKDIEYLPESSTSASFIPVELSSTVSISTPFASAETSTARSDTVTSSATDHNSTLSEFETSGSSLSEASEPVNSLSETFISSPSDVSAKSPSVRLVPTKISIKGSHSTLSRSDSSRSSLPQLSYPVNPSPAHSTSTPVSSISTSSASAETSSVRSDSVTSSSTNSNSILSESATSTASSSEEADPVNPPSANSMPTSVSPISSSIDSTSVSSKDIKHLPESSTFAPSIPVEFSSTVSISTSDASGESYSIQSEPVVPELFTSSLSETSVSSTSNVSVKSPSGRVIPTKISIKGSHSTLSRSDSSGSSLSQSSYPVNPSPENSTSTPVSPITAPSTPTESSFARSGSVVSSATDPNSTFSGSDTSTVSPSGSSGSVNSLSASSTSAVSSVSVGTLSPEAKMEGTDLVAILPVESPSASAETSSARSDVSSSSTDSHSTLSKSNTSTASSSETSVSSTSSPVDTTSVPSKSGETLPENSLSASSDSIEFSPADSTPTLSASSPSSVESMPVPPIPVKPDISTTPRIRAVVPQLPTYLLLPNTLFYAGLIDLTSQNKKLEAMQNTSASSLKGDEKSVFFVRGYGGSHHYASNLSAFEYGYGADFDYTALEAGVLLKEIESLYSRASFGFMGTYGSLSLHPQDVKHSTKSPFDKWSIASYGNLQHDTGVYMDGVFSYGLFRGDVFTLARGKAATLKGKQFSASLTSGKAFAMGYKSVVFDPQVQLVYQHLQFGRARDVDHIDVDLGKFSQWTGRIGARLSKTLTTLRIGRIVSFYSTLYFSHSFRDRQFVSFKKDFQLSDLGSPLELGVGFNARLSPKFVLHGDIIYQHRLTKAGVSGASFSAGLRHLF